MAIYYEIEFFKWYFVLHNIHYIIIAGLQKWFLVFKIVNVLMTRRAYSKNIIHCMEFYNIVGVSCRRQANNGNFQVFCLLIYFLGFALFMYIRKYPPPLDTGGNVKEKEVREKGKIHVWKMEKTKS